jgi:hypothetical protein
MNKGPIAFVADTSSGPRVVAKLKDRALKEALQAMADKEGRSLAFVVNRALREYMERKRGG